jgi:hypothetical protein
LTAFYEQEMNWKIAVDLEELQSTGTKINLMISTAYVQGKLPPQL